VTCPAQDWPAALRARPLCARRKLVIPFIAEIGPDGVANFGVFDGDRVKDCLDGRLCAMCGDPMGTEIAFIGDREALVTDKQWIEPPVHERCGEIALGGLCPFMSQEGWRHGRIQDGVGIIGIDPAELEQIGRTVAKRPSVMAITRTYKPLLVRDHDGSAAVMYQAGPIRRVRRYEWRDGRLAEVTRPPVTVIRAQRRKRPRARR
jgi:hypothetical protein